MARSRDSVLRIIYLIFPHFYSRQFYWEETIKQLTRNGLIQSKTCRHVSLAVMKTYEKADTCRIWKIQIFYVLFYGNVNRVFRHFQ